MTTVRAGAPALMFLIGLLIGALVGGASAPAAARGPAPSHPALDALLWVQTAAEYRFVARQAYALATLRLDEALKTPGWSAALEQRGGAGAGHPPAVILDVDETVLDNAPYQASLVVNNTRFDRASWERWVGKAAAAAVPGAVEFVRSARRRGVTVFFVTNRDRGLEAATRRNLTRRGFPVSSEPDTVLMRDERPEWGWDKTSRRAHVARRYRILLLVGDDLNDFAPARLEPARRAALVETHRDFVGRRWILLPNPLYGSWEGALYGFGHTLAPAAKERRKRRWLRPFE